MVHDQFGVIAGMLGRPSAKVEAMLRDAADDLLAFHQFPPNHWKKIWSTNPLERLSKEFKRVCKTFGVTPDHGSDTDDRDDVRRERRGHGR
jgi:putative transposase